MSTRTVIAPALFSCVVLCSAVVSVSVAPTMANAASGSGGSVVVTNYTSPTISRPSGITKGPDGALWFTNQGNDSIGRITTAGVVTNFTGAGINEPFNIVTGPDGALWFTNQGDQSIGRITTSGAVTSYHVGGLRGPWDITAGPDGALWFTMNGDSAIGRITTAGAITTYTDTRIELPWGITAGPDGALWFANYRSIGRITTDGTLTVFPDESIHYPWGITAGPDGALWYTINELVGGGPTYVGRITTAGAITHFTDPNLHAPLYIAPGFDGALWFTSGAPGGGPNSVGRITTSGAVTVYTDPSMSRPAGITASDGAMWFTNIGNNSIGRIAPGQPTVVPGGGAVAEGDAGSSELQVPVTLSNPSTDEVRVQWNTAFLGAGSPIEADPANDYVATSGTVTFAPGETHKTVSITVNGDLLVEPDEWLLVSFHDATNATIGGYGGLGFGVIKNDDHATIVPGGGSVVEGNAGTSELGVGVALSNPSVQPVTVQWRTTYLGGASGIEADPASDYTAASGTVTFAPGETAKTVPIAVNGDTLVEPDEWIIVSLHDATNATIGGYGGLGFGVIVNDDAP